MENDFEKIDGENMRSNLNASEINRGINENIESVDKNEAADSQPAFTPLSENSGQAMARLLGPIELLSNAWQLYKSRWKTLLGVVITPILLMFLAYAVFGIGVLGMGILRTFISASPAVNIIIYLIGFILLLILFLTIIIIQFWSQAALVYAIKDSEENIGIKESYKRGWHKVRSFFWVSILSGFIIMGGYIFFIIPGIIFTVWFSLAIYIVIAEDLKGMSALLKSREYVRNYWWSVLWRFLFIGLLVCLFVLIVGIFFMILGIILGLGSNSLETIVNFVNLLINIISLIFAPLMVIYSFLIYNNLKEIKGDFEFKPSKKSKRSFVAIGILGFIIIPLLLISSIALISLNSARDKAMDATRRLDMAQIKINLIIYRDEQGEYPKLLDELNINFKDPKTKKPYEYRQLDDGKNYEICVQFIGKGRECFYSEDSVYETSNKYEYDDNINNTEKETSNDSIIKRDTQRISDLEFISAMLEYCKTKTGIYPLSHTASKLNENNHVVSVIKFANSNTDIPVDPKEPEYYYGYKSLDGKSFELTARLENINDPRCELEIKGDNGICIYKYQN